MRRFGLFLFPAAVTLVASLLVARVTAFPGGEDLPARTDRLGPCAVEFVTGTDALDVRCGAQAGRVGLRGLAPLERRPARSSRRCDAPAAGAAW